jgi:hypothetical protein
LDCFWNSRDFASVTFERGSTLRQIGETELAKCGLTPIVIPASVEAIVISCFRGCSSLSSVVFEVGSTLQGRESELLVGSGRADEVSEEEAEIH